MQIYSKTNYTTKYWKNKEIKDNQKRKRSLEIVLTLLFQFYDIKQKFDIKNHYQLCKGQIFQL